MHCIIRKTKTRVYLSVYQTKCISNLNPTLVWSIAKKVPPYSNISKKCLLCFYKKRKIVFNYLRPDELLNKRSELILKCCYANKFLLRNYKANH